MWQHRSIFGLTQKAISKYLAAVCLQSETPAFAEKKVDGLWAEISLWVGSLFYYFFAWDQRLWKVYDNTFKYA